MEITAEMVGIFTTAAGGIAGFIKVQTKVSYLMAAREKDQARIKEAENKVQRLQTKTELQEQMITSNLASLRDLQTTSHEHSQSINGVKTSIEVLSQDVKRILKILEKPGD